jgi:cytoskeletal protein RodZ
MTNKNREKRNLLINPSFQLQFIALMILIYVIVSSSFYIANLYFFSELNRFGHDLALTPDHIFFQIVKKEQKMMQSVYLAASAVLFVVLGLAGVLISHRIAGPIYRLQQHFLKTKKSQPQKNFHFRKGDFFPELAEAYNLHCSDESSSK